MSISGSTNSDFWVVINHGFTPVIEATMSERLGQQIWNINIDYYAGCADLWSYTSHNKIGVSLLMNL